MAYSNHLPFPRKRSEAFRAGWRACEVGSRRNAAPYWSEQSDRTLNERFTLAMQWGDGFDARAEQGFDTTHLPRKICSDAFAL